MWNKINCGLNVEDETVTFGTRIVAASGTHVYETKTLATIQGDETQVQLEQFPKPLAIFYPQTGLCVAVENTLVLFDVICSQVLWNLDFDSKIGCFTLSNDGVFLFVALNNLELYCVHLKTHQCDRLSFNIEPKNRMDQLASMSIISIVTEYNEKEFPNYAKLFSLLLIFDCGLILRLSNLNLLKLDEAYDTNDSKAVHDILNAVDYRTHEIPNSIEAKCRSVCKLYKNIFIVAGNYLMKWQLDLEALSKVDASNQIGLIINRLPSEISIVKLEALQKQLLVGLTVTGSLLMICPHTLLPLYEYKSDDEVPISSFTILDGTTEQNMMAFTKDKLISITRTGFVQKFDLKLPNASVPVVNQNEEDDSYEGFMFMEFCNEKGTTSLRVKLVDETQPQCRLEKLLRKAKYNEAEKFANTFNLDVQLVYKARASGMLEALQPWTNSQRCSLDDFLAVLEMIEDVEFVIACCINVIVSESENTRKLLNYGLERLRMLSNKKNADSSAFNIKLQSDLGSVILRLDTYMLIYPSSSSSVDLWLSFSKADLLKEIHQHLKKGEMKEATLIWTRHWNQLHLKLEPEMAVQLLEDIPTWVSANSLLNWLNEFLPIILRNHPLILNNVLGWVVTKIKSFELLDRQSWPDGGIHVAVRVLEIVQKSGKSFSWDVVGLDHSPIKHLQTFLRTLHQLSRLKNIYNLIISYDEFVQDKFEEVVFILLDRVPVDGICDLVNDLLHQMLLEKSLDSDTVFRFYVQTTIKNLPSWCFFPGAPWELRTTNVTRAIYNTQNHLESVLHVIKAAAVPWSNTVQQLVDQALTLKHPLTASIHEACALIPSKLVLRKYGFIDVTDNNEKLERIILNIIHSNNEEKLSDSLVLAKATDLEDEIYVEMLRPLIEKGDDKKINALLDGLDELLVNKIWYKIGLRLNVSRDFGADKVKPYLEYSICMEKAGYDVKGLLKSYSLEVETNLKTSIIDMHKDKFQKNAAEHAYTIIMNESIASSTGISGLIERARRVSRVLEVPLKSALLRLASLTFHNGHGEYALELLSYFSNSLEDDLSDEINVQLLKLFAEHIPDLAEHISTNTSHEKSSIVKLLSDIILSTCDSGILNAVELSQWVSLITGCVPQVTLFAEPLHPTTVIEILSNFTRSILGDYICLAKNLNNRVIQKAFQFPVGNMQTSIVEALSNTLINITNQLCELEQSSVCLQVICIIYSTLSSAFAHAQHFSTLTTLTESQETLLDLWCTVMKPETWDPLLKMCVYDMLRKLTNSRHFDLTLGLTLLNYLPVQSALEWLQNQSNMHYEDLSHLKYVSLLGSEYCKLRGKRENHSKFLDLNMKCGWGSRLLKLGISYREFIQMEEKDVIIRLTSVPEVDLALLQEYCAKTNFDFQECLYIYVNHFVLSWVPEVVITVDSAGTRVMKVTNNANNILKQMRSVFSLIKDYSEFIDHCTTGLWRMVNCYYYEIYFVLLDLFNHAQEQLAKQGVVITKSQIDCMLRHQNILTFLVSYTRVCPPSTREREEFYKDYPTAHLDLPAISEFRLPFTYLEADPYRTIKPELNLSTYKLWFSVSSLLSLDKFALCSIAIYRLCVEKLTPAANAMKGEWCVHVCNEKLLKDVTECVSYIDNYGVACACLFFVVNNLPPGADQVQAAQLCYNHTVSWLNQDHTRETQEKLLKVQKKLLRVSTTHILYMHDLAKPEYLDLVLSPIELISALYHDPAVLTRENSQLVHCPDIHTAVEHIGQLHGESIAAVKWDLIKKWMLPENSLDDTIISHATMMRSMSQLATYDSSLIRACYVLSHESPRVACDYLVSIAFTREAQSVSVQLRALQCLVKIATPQHILEVTGRDLNSIRKYMKSLWFVYGLEQLGWVCTVDMFESRNKAKLVDQMLSAELSASVVILASHICQAFSINKPQFWNTILKFLTTSNMVDQLKDILPRLEVEWHLLDTDTIASAWNCTVLNPLSQVELGGDEEMQVKESLLWVQKCPSPNLLDMKSFREHLERLKCIALLPKFY